MLHFAIIGTITAILLYVGYNFKKGFFTEIIPFLNPKKHDKLTVEKRLGFMIQTLGKIGVVATIISAYGWYSGDVLYYNVAYGIMGILLPFILFIEFYTLRQDELK